MGEPLDIKYRPKRYDEVLGQGRTKTMLRHIVASGQGRHQSYLFAGLSGSGKTTLGRILARALLCENPVNGDPCDQCDSCLEILQQGTSDAFTEIDAATNSGKDSIRSILSNIEYATFSGRRRFYLFDEAHQLSKDAMDALLKPMEDTDHETGGRRLTCIFCTTEPEKMRDTVAGRCGPTFVIRVVSPQKIAERLRHICDQEGFEAEDAALLRIAEGAEGGIRAAIKSLESLTRLPGPTTLDSVREFLGDDLNDLVLEVLEGLGSDVSKALQATQTLLEKVSPATLYKRLSEAALLSFKVALSVEKAATYWDSERLSLLGKRHGDGLLLVSESLASRPRRPTREMLECDLFLLHRQFSGSRFSLLETRSSSPAQIDRSLDLPHPSLEKSEPTKTSPEKVSTEDSATVPESSSRLVSMADETYIEGGVYVDPRAVNRNSPGASPVAKESSSSSPPDQSSPVHHEGAESSVDQMGLGEFCSLLRNRLLELGMQRSVAQGGSDRASGQESPGAAASDGTGVL